MLICYLGNEGILVDRFTIWALLPAR